MILKLKVSKTEGGEKYEYDRSTIGIGSPIDIELNTVQFSGVIIELSDKPITDHYVEKTITVAKKNAYPWEYESIIVGDSFSNGQIQTLQIISKQAMDTYTLGSDTYGNYPYQPDELKRYIVVKMKMKGQIVNGQFVYAGDQAIMPGRVLPVATPNYVFSDFMVEKVE